MIRLKAIFANWLWRKLCEPARTRLLRSLDHPEVAQEAVLKRILENHGHCAYGRSLELHAGMDYAAFAKATPLVTYDELAPWIERAKQGEKEVLCGGELLAFERSSGSTAAAKFIPFNLDLRREFQEAVRAWMGDLMKHYPNLSGGRAWWVVSPLSSQGSATTAGGIPIGLANDDEYLGWWERKFASWLRIDCAHGSQDPLEGAARALLMAQDLRLISVWNPSYLALLWERVRSAHGGEVTTAELWPQLQVISGWADASAEADAASIAQLFPHATFQPKGLLATEGVVTIPWGGGSPIPALHSHFLEFQHCGTDEVVRVHELQLDEEYEVILTTSGGLWRYRLGDIVRVDGHAANTPRLRLQGRRDGGCDLRGEKLNPRFVQQALRKLTTHFTLLAPSTDAPLPGYVLFTTDRSLRAEAVDEALQENPYYAHAQRVGQLASVKLFIIGDPLPAQKYLQRCVALGQRPSTVKATALHRLNGWEDWFTGGFQP